MDRFSFDAQTVDRSRARARSDGYLGKVPVHDFTHNPKRAWEMLSVKQVVKPSETTDPSTPIPDDVIRFVTLSDTHAQIERRNVEDFVPNGDVLLHAGDFTNCGHLKDVKRFNTFLGSLPHRRKIVIAGNHDLTFDMDMVKNQRQYLSGRFGLSVSAFEDVLAELKVESARELLTSCIYLEDSSVEVCGIKIYGSPWQPEFGNWGFNLERGTPCLQKWDLIPDDTDILMTHGPPLGHGDLCSSKLRAGCVELLSTIQKRVKPTHHVFGHIHEGYGATTDGQTVFINASTCTLHYKATNLPIVFDVPIPKGHSKAELDQLPVNNLKTDKTIVE